MVTSRRFLRVILICSPDNACSANAEHYHSSDRCLPPRDQIATHKLCIFARFWKTSFGGGTAYPQRALTHTNRFFRRRHPAQASNAIKKKDKFSILLSNRRKFYSAHQKLSRIKRNNRVLNLQSQSHPNHGIEGSVGARKALIWSILKSKMLVLPNRHEPWGFGLELFIRWKKNTFDSRIQIWNVWFQEVSSSFG